MPGPDPQALTLTQTQPIGIYPNGQQAALTLYNPDATATIIVSSAANTGTGFPIGPGDTIVWDEGKPLYAWLSAAGQASLIIIGNSGGITSAKAIATQIVESGLSDDIVAGLVAGLPAPSAAAITAGGVPPLTTQSVLSGGVFAGAGPITQSFAIPSNTGTIYIGLKPRSVSTWRVRVEVGNSVGVYYTNVYTMTVEAETIGAIPGVASHNFIIPAQAADTVFVTATRTGGGGFLDWSAFGTNVMPPKPSLYSSILGLLPSTGNLLSVNEDCVTGWDSTAGFGPTASNFNVSLPGREGRTSICISAANITAAGTISIASIADTNTPIWSVLLPVTATTLIITDTFQSPPDSLRCYFSNGFTTTARLRIALSTER